MKTIDGKGGTHGKDNNIVIETKRLILKPFCEEYLTEEYVSWLNDDELVKYSEQRHYKHTFKSCKEYYLSFQDAENLFYAILLKENENHIGNINVYIDKYNLLADIGILIGDKSASGCGYGTEAWTGMMGYLFERKDVRKITAGTMEHNRAMIIIFEKCKMEYEARKVRHYLFEGKEVDMVYYAAFRNEWLKNDGLYNELIYKKVD